MARVPHLPQILQGPLAARPSAAKTPDWVWYFAWDDDGGAFWRPTSEGWVKATPSVGTAAWSPLELAGGWAHVDGVPCEYRVHHGAVELRGAADAAGSLPSVLTTLPGSARPPYEVRLAALAGDVQAIVTLTPEGGLTVEAVPTTGASGSAIRLDGLRFPL